jgi:hypothetical protein
MPQPQFNFSAIQVDGQEAASRSLLILWLNRQFTLLKQTLRGATDFDAGTATAAKTLTLITADLTFLELAGNTAITLNKPRTGATAHLEIAQDATGSRTPTWINATGNGGSVPAPASGAGKKTLYYGVFNGTNWVLSVLASNY